jgi:hypothetical protein
VTVRCGCRRNRVFNLLRLEDGPSACYVVRSHDNARAIRESHAYFRSASVIGEHHRFDSRRFERGPRHFSLVPVSKRRYYDQIVFHWNTLILFSRTTLHRPALFSRTTLHRPALGSAHALVPATAT